jgi:release factor glutamine methyltransferase
MNIRNFFRSYVLELQTVYNDTEAIRVAEMVFEAVTGYSRHKMKLEPDAKISAQQSARMLEMLTELKAHKPAQYVIGKCWFYDLEFDVNPAVLIPRPETEELVYTIIQNPAVVKHPKVLDIGTGSGCIAVTLKKYLSDTDVTAIDTSPEALMTAQQNAKKHHAAIRFLQCNFLSMSERNALGVYDIIVSNPPYIPPAEKNEMEPNVVQYEPHSALFADDPLIFYKAIVEFAHKHLSKDGYVYVEIHKDKGKEVVDIFADNGFSASVTKDMSGNNRFVHAKRT